jgi:hypothetical protein
MKTKLVARKDANDAWKHSEDRRQRLSFLVSHAESFGDTTSQSILSKHSNTISALSCSLDRSLVIDRAHVPSIGAASTSSLRSKQSDISSQHTERNSVRSKVSSIRASFPVIGT